VKHSTRLEPGPAGTTSGQPVSRYALGPRLRPVVRRTAEPAAFHVKHSPGSEPGPAGTTSGQPVNRYALGPRLRPVVAEQPSRPRCPHAGQPTQQPFT
jgi:hypothetical protein